MPKGIQPIPFVSRDDDDEDENLPGKLNQRALKAYTRLKQAFADAKNSEDMSANQAFIEQALPEFFAELHRSGILVDDVLVHEMIAVFAAYLKLEVGWKFSVAVQASGAFYPVTFEVETVHCPELVQQVLAESTSGVAPTPGGCSWKVCPLKNPKPIRTLLMMTGTSSAGKSKDRKLSLRPSGAFSDADKEIGIGFVEDADSARWLQQAFQRAAREGRQVVVTGHSLGAGGAQIVCRTALEKKWVEIDKLYGYFFSPPSPSKLPPSEWTANYHHFYFCANGADPVSNMGGVYYYPGKEFVLPWSSTPWIAGSQDVWIDKVLLSHGKPNVLFARMSNVPCSFVARKSVTEIPSQYREMFWRLMDKGRQSVAHKGFKPVLVEHIVSHVESSWSHVMPPVSGQRGHRLSVLCQLIAGLPLSGRLPPHVLVDALLEDGSFDQLYTSNQESAIRRVCESLHRTLADPDMNEEQFLLDFEATKYLKSCQFESRLRQALLETTPDYKKKASFELLLLAQSSQKK